MLDSSCSAAANGGCALSRRAAGGFRFSSAMQWRDAALVEHRSPCLSPGHGQGISDWGRRSMRVFADLSPAIPLRGAGACRDWGCLPGGVRTARGTHTRRAPRSNPVVVVCVCGRELRVQRLASTGRGLSTTAPGSYSRLSKGPTASGPAQAQSRARPAHPARMARNDRRVGRRPGRFQWVRGECRRPGRAVPQVAAQVVGAVLATCRRIGWTVASHDSPIAQDALPQSLGGACLGLPVVPNLTRTRSEQGSGNHDCHGASSEPACSAVLPSACSRSWGGCAVVPWSRRGVRVEGLGLGRGLCWFGLLGVTRSCPTDCIAGPVSGPRPTFLRNLKPGCSCIFRVSPLALPTKSIV
jgi:hypothetical protein